MARRGHSGRSDSGSLLASVFILALGAGSCLFGVAALSPNSLPNAMWIVGSITGSFILFIVLQRFGVAPKADLSFLLSSQRNRRDDGVKDYEPRKAGDNVPLPVGTNEPISAQEAHEIKVTSANTWVPSPSRSGKRK